MFVTFLVEFAGLHLNKNPCVKNEPQHIKHSARL